MIHFYLILYVILLLQVNSCANIPKTDFGPDSFVIEGKMVFLDVEGGCWQFISTNNETYELVGENIETIYFDGIQARLVVRELEDRVSICMVGKIVEVLKIVNLSKP